MLFSRTPWRQRRLKVSELLSLVVRTKFSGILDTPRCSAAAKLSPARLWLAGKLLNPRLEASDLLAKSSIFMPKLCHHPSARRGVYGIQELHADPFILPPFEGTLDESPTLQNIQFEFGREGGSLTHLKPCAAQRHVPDDTIHRTVLEPDIGLKEGL
jgi:hypothetical protein